jgi:holo-[acyl-carrier protein] synthase
MTVLGVGVDLVDIERFSRALERTPALRQRLFGPLDTESQDLAGQSLAARFAAKEATLKALGGNVPGLSGGVAERAAHSGVTSTHLSLSHDAGMAIAFVVVDGEASS